MKTIATDTLITIPDTVAVCPICGAAVTVEIDEWEQLDDGSWVAGECGTHTSCITEPDADSSDYENWLSEHFNMPYVDWLPMDSKIKEWLDENYRFDLSRDA